MGSDLKRKITALLDQVFPEFERPVQYNLRETALAVLRQYPAPEKLARSQTGKLTGVLQNASNGRFGEWKATRLKELARNNFGNLDCKGTYSALLPMYLGQLQSLQDAAATLEKRVAVLFSQFDSTLTPISGIGPVLGTVILSEIRDISCFTSADKLTAYAGLNPKVKPSGDMKSSVVHMSKRDSLHLRRVIWMAGAIAVQYDPMSKVYCEKKTAEGLRYMNTIGHVSKKMTVVIFAVMQDNKIYDLVLPVACCQGLFHHVYKLFTKLAVKMAGSLLRFPALTHIAN